jgi:hypothetical protein
LVAAITAANSSGPTTLVLAADCDYLVEGPAGPSTGLPVITGNVSLLGGHGPNVDAGPGTTTISLDPAVPPVFGVRILQVAAGGTLQVRSLTIANGFTFGGLGGGIFNAGTLFVANSTVTGNRAGNGGGLANIAGATATIISSNFSGNTTTGVGGGAILNQGTLTVRNSSLSSNTAPVNGGGLNTQPGGVSTLIQSTVDHNTAGGLGGGISNLGTTSLVRTTVEFNTATNGGGGIATGNNSVFLSQSTVAFNTPDNCLPLNTIPGCVN